MSTLIDLTGRRFGRLKVLRRGEDYVSPSGNHRVQWVCRCDCGKETLTSGRNLINGRTKSCGCLHNEIVGQLGRSSRDIFYTPEKEATVNKCYNLIKVRAKRKGFSFTITKKDIADIIFQPCHYCGKEGSNNFRRKNTLPHSGIDRKDSSKGYTPGNIVPCCSSCNTRKSTTPYSEFVARVKALIPGRKHT